MRYLAYVSLFLFLLASTENASASCLVFNQNERLSNYCLLETLKGKVVDQDTVNILTDRLKQEGYLGGLEKPNWSTNVSPTIDYSRNINGGNPDRALVIGGLEFQSDPEFLRQEGVITSVRITTTNRNTFGVGKYLHSSLSAAYSYSPEHDNGYTDASLNTCYKNQLAQTNFLDVCASGKFQKKEFSDDNSKSLSLHLSDLNYDDDLGTSQSRIGIIHFSNLSYSQNQIEFSWDLISKEKYFLSTSARFGDAVENETALKYGLVVNFSKILKNRKYIFSLVHEVGDGGELLGVARRDSTNKVTVQSSLNSKVIITAAYTATNSTIDYYDESYPSVYLTFNW